jgi:hypothetical protein
MWDLKNKEANMEKAEKKPTKEIKKETPISFMVGTNAFNGTIIKVQDINDLLMATILLDDDSIMGVPLSALKKEDLDAFKIKTEKEAMEKEKAEKEAAKK